MSLDRGVERGVGRVVERMLDLTVFGPLGFLLEARRLVPELAERGREHVDLQVRTARTVGRFAAQLGRRALRPATPSRVGADALASADGHRPGAPSQDLDAREVDRTRPDVAVRIIDEIEPDGIEPEGVEPEGIEPESLPIEGYDALAASQIVARLGGLGQRELELVQGYEAAHRGRRTILHRTGQLLSGR
jgi:hypothetical protein